MAKIKVDKYRKFSGSGGMTAFADITISDAITVCGCRLMNGDKGFWVAYPSNKVEKDGETKYYPYVKFPKQELLKEILDAFIEEHNRNEGAGVALPGKQEGDIF